MTMPAQGPEIFDRARRRRKRDRAVASHADHAFLRDHIVESLIERLDLVTRTFADALDLGCADGSLSAALRGRGMRVVSADAGFGFAVAAHGVQCDEDRLPFADGSFDLVVSAGVLDQVNDLPGALALIRRVLRPDGLFLGGFVGAGSLAGLRGALIAADMMAGGAIASRMHPQIDLRAGADLLQRAGFALPVADGEGLDVRYGDVLRLMADLRGMAATNMLLDRAAPPLDRARIAAAMAHFAEGAAADGRVRERFEIVFLTGWAPAPSQPGPARRGSGSQSLASALPRPRKD
ncbi:class I SAM-dependent methyltransferase [Sphingomonas profundi]|uniref:class I SAM-dependent methyltransferase n=1 Tax=Alterirhizorhabdus profundi TaxID=2681549 RepID=UPI0012E7A58C|nr:class I SAM-dependent methyltransferase [Sphingomonas profundi]